MKNVQIRDCTHEDIDAIVQMDNQWEGENITHDFIHYGREEIVAFLERSSVYFLVAECDERVVGYINGSVHFNEKIPVISKQEQYLEIDNVYVEPNYRGRGIGSKLMDRLFARAKQNGVQRFLVDSVSTEMDKIIAFYRSHDFRLWYVQLFK